MRLFGHILLPRLSCITTCSVFPSVQMDKFAVDKLSRLQIKQQVGHFSNFG